MGIAMGKDHDPHLHTISSRPGQRSSSQALEVMLTEAEKQRLAAILTALSSHYWRPDFSPTQVGYLIADYCQDLAICRLDEIEIAIREYRLNPKEKFYPKSSQLREIVFANRKHRKELERLGPKVTVLPRPIRWWDKPRSLWGAEWREEDIPPGELVRDADSGQLREPNRS